ISCFWPRRGTGPAFNAYGSTPRPLIPRFWPPITCGLRRGPGETLEPLIEEVRGLTKAGAEKPRPDLLNHVGYFSWRNAFTLLCGLAPTEGRISIHRDA